ncbi:enoyl-CoA hydratase/isomerase family protein [bacterium]|nr:enoyl-CoA hydratase/isomerase family protein [bacterium]
MPFENLELRHEGALSWLTVQRPKALNALNAELLAELGEALDQLEARAASGETRVLAVTGAGEKAFVAGADIGEIAPLRGAAGRTFAERGQAIFSRVENLPVPVIAALNGYALGGGCELALACHLRVAADTAVLGLPEVTLGVIPGYGGTQRLPRLVGPGRALDLILTGRMVKAPEALELGLVNRVVPAAELLDAVQALAAKLQAVGPLAQRAALEAVREGLQGTLAEGLAVEARLFGGLCDTADMVEGTAAFLEKRKAAFTGK